MTNERRTGREVFGDIVIELIEHVRMRAPEEHHPDRRRVLEWLGRELLEEAS